MKAVLIKEKQEYVLHKYADAEVLFAMSNRNKADEKQLRYLDKKNCDAIFGLLDPKQMSDEYAEKIKGITKDERELARISYRDGLILGINNFEDKEYNEQDLLDALTWASMLNNAHQTLNQAYINNYLKKLKEKRKNDAVLVDIEMQYLPVTTFCFSCGKGSEALNQTICENQNACTNWFPNYDSNGCLILKKVLK